MPGRVWRRRLALVYLVLGLALIASAAGPAWPAWSTQPRAGAQDVDPTAPPQEEPGAADTDADGVQDAQDNCPDVANPDQADADGDLIGDACDAPADADADGVPDEADNCPGAANPDQADADIDGIGDACDAPADADADGVPDEADNCPAAANPDQGDANGNGIGDACEAAEPPTEVPPPLTETPVPTPTETPQPTPTDTPTMTPTPAVWQPFVEDFEHGDLRDWEHVEGLVVQQAEVLDGQFAGRAIGDGVDPSFAHTALSLPQHDLYLRLRFKLLSQNEDPVYLLRFRSEENSSIMGIFVDPEGAIGLRNDATDERRLDQTTVQAGSWYELRLRVRTDPNGGAGEVEVWIDGTRLDDLTGPQAFAPTPVGRLQIGESSTERTFDVAIDDILVDTAPIQADSRFAAPLPTPTVTPTSVPTPAPTSAPTPTETAVPTPTATPTSTEAPTATPTPTPTEEVAFALAAAPTAGGLRGDYFDNGDLTGFKLTRDDPTIDFDWGTGSPDPSIAVNTFSIRWTGQILADVTSTYTFTTTSSDGVRLWIDGRLVINNWVNQATTIRTGQIDLQAGVWYSIKIEYYENTNAAMFRLSYAADGIPPQIVPSDHLSPDAAPDPTPTATPTATPEGQTEPGAFHESNGQVVMEAENSHSSVMRGDQSWTRRTDFAGYVGESSVQALLDAGTAINTGYATTSPELSFTVRFDTPGTYRVWLRGWGPNGDGDSVHIGLDGQEVASADRIQVTSGGTWRWTSSSMDNVQATVTVATAGVHTVHVWMREDGFRLDRILLTTSTTTPTGNGPAESAREGDATPTPTPTATATATIVPTATATATPTTVPTSTMTPTTAATPTATGTVVPTATPDPSATVTPTATATAGATPVPGGLRGEYFNNSDLTASLVVRTDPVVDFSWGTGSPDPAIGGNTFSARWTGQVLATVTGTYTFYTSSNDGVRLWVNNQLLISNWTDHAVTENSGQIALEAGRWYPIRMEYYENVGSAIVRLSYAAAGLAKQVIPAANLSPAASSDPTPTPTATPAPAPTPPVKVNFQPETAAVPDGYLRDVGRSFDPAVGFGWVRPGTTDPVDMTPSTRLRSGPADLRLRTLMHMQGNGGSTQPNVGAWEYVVPNGTYTVTVSVGDNDFFDSTHRITVEGVVAINNFVPSTATKFGSGTVSVTVNDGRLTVEASGGANTKINYVDILPFDPNAPTPTPTATPAATSTPPPGSGGLWESRAPSTATRQEVSYTAVGEKFYLAGGQPTGGGRTTLHEAYDPATNTWTTVAPMPVGVDHIQSVVVNGSIYYIGGLTGFPGPSIDDVYIYDPATDTFTPGTSMPAGRDRGAGGVAVHGGKIYYYGGVHTSGGSTVAVPWFDVYDPATNSWTPLPDMPRARDHSHAAIVGNVLYAIGGRDGVSTSTVTAVDAFDFGTGTWSSALPALPTARSGNAVAVVGTEIFVIGGEVGGVGAFTTVEALDTTTGTWKSYAPLSTPRHGIQAVVCNGGIYIAGGGRTAGGGTPVNTHEVFFPSGTATSCGSGGPATTTPTPTATPGSGGAGPIAWSTVAQSPLGRAEAPGAMVDGKLYVFGGYTDSTFVPNSVRVDVYDTATDTWTRLGDSPTSMTHAGVAVVGRDIYMAGCVCGDGAGNRINASTDVWRYNIDADSWTAATPLPAPRGAGALALLDGKLHFLGGTDLDRGNALTDHLVLDLTNGGGWTPAAPVPVARNHVAAVSLAGLIYVIGGQTGHNETAVMRAEVYSYDPATDTWTQRASLPRQRSHITESTVLWNGRIIVLGGEIGHANIVNEVDEYDPVTDTWRTLTSLPSPRNSGVAGVAGDVIYYTMGAPGFGTTTYKGVIGGGPAGTPTPTPTATATPEPTGTATPLPAGEGGLTGRYFDNQDLTGFKLTRVDPRVNFTWGTGSPDPTIGADTFSVRWTGQVLAEHSETYTFYTSSNDGVRLWVNGQQVINNWTAHAVTENSGTITLAAGNWYAITLEYFEGTGSAVIVLSYSSPSTPKQVIADTRLSPTICTSPCVTGSAPASGATGVRRDTAVNADVYLPNVGMGVDQATLNTDNVSLVRTSDGALVPGTINTTGGGDAIVYQPATLLDANTNYTFTVTDAVKDDSGDSFIPFTMRFTTGSQPSSVSPAATFSKTEVFVGDAVSSVTIDPAGDYLYASFLDGRLTRWAIGPDGLLSGEETFTGLSGRAIIGIVFDPSNPSVLWVSHNNPVFPQPAQDWSGEISKVFVAGGLAGATVQDYVIGLPRSAKDHLSNSLAFGPDGMLYLTQGSNTAMGAPDNAWALRPERLLSGAVLRINPGWGGGVPINVRTEGVVTPYDPFAPGAPVSIYGSGVRNAYDLVWHSNGRLYVPTNGSAAGGNTPGSPAGVSPVAPALNNVGTQDDFLYAVSSGGYYGHPNPTRSEYALNGANPTGGSDPAEVVDVVSGGQVIYNGYPAGVEVDNSYGFFVWDFGRNRSPNGVIEYRSGTFGGVIQNRVLVVEYSGGDRILVLTPDATGGIASAAVLGVNGGLTNPLDLIEDTSNGNIYVVELVVFSSGGASGRISVLRPT